MRQQLILMDPTLGLELPPLENSPIEPLTPKQVWSLIDAAKEIGGIGCPMTYLGASLGPRRNELLALYSLTLNGSNTRCEFGTRFRRDVAGPALTNGSGTWGRPNLASPFAASPRRKA